MKKALTLIFCFIPINFVKVFLLNIIGHKISYSARIGLSYIFVEKLILGDNSNIKHFNYLKVSKVHLEKGSFIKNLNYIKGHFSLKLEENAGISNQNKIRRAYPPVVTDSAELHVGKNSIIVSNHFLDITRSIFIGENSILAGIRSQLWTHGYYHADEGKDRVRIDGEIKIGDNVYIGSSCIFNPGVKVSNAIHIGSGSVISKDLEKPGMYVNQGLRFIDNNLENIKTKLKRVDDKRLVEEVYTKE